MRERVLRELSGTEVLHLRELLRRLGTSISELKPVLDEMVEEGLLEKFSHGGYTFYRITGEGRGFLLRMEAADEEVELGEEGVKSANGLADEGEMGGQGGGGVIEGGRGAR